MQIKVKTGAPESLTITLDVAADTTIQDLKRELSCQPHSLHITPRTAVFAKLQKGLLVKLSDLAKVRRVLILQGLGDVRPLRLDASQQDPLIGELKTLRSNPDPQLNAGLDSPHWRPPLERSFRLVIVRHGERVDQVFGQRWLLWSFPHGEEGGYVQRDLNMPKSLPHRPLDHWALDPPITELGRWQAQRLGEALAEHPPIGAVYSSPAWRCRQTAKELQAQLPGQPPVRVEPGLFELGSWLRLNRELTPATATAALFVKTGGWGGREGAEESQAEVPLTSTPSDDEGVEEWYRRSSAVLWRLMEHHASCGTGDLLLVAHGLSHEVLTYGVLSGHGPVPPPVLAASSREAKIYVMKARGIGGTAPVNTSCGAAAFWYSNVKNSLTSLQDTGDVPLTLTHHQNPRFLFSFMATPVSAPEEAPVSASDWLVLPSEL